MSFKKNIHLLIGCLFVFSISIYAQKWAPYIGQKLSPIENGKGFVVEDFNHFKGNILHNIYPSLSNEIGDAAADSLRVKADSLGRHLIEKGTLTINESDINILPYLNIYSGEEIMVANLVFTVNRLGGVKSLNYEVKKGDTLNIVYRIIKGSGFDEIEIIEGKELRFNFSKNKKNQEIKSTLIAAMDGVIAINLTNKGLLRSKGKLIITKKESQKKIVFKYQCDTLFNQVKVKKVLHDTIVESLYNQSVSIPSSVDITRSNNLNIPIDFANEKKYFAWAYWIGSNKTVKQEWQKQVESNNPKGPLANYLLQELSKKGFEPLPEEKNPDISFKIEDKSSNILRTYQGIYKGNKVVSTSFNSRNNYAAYRINNPDQPFGLSMTLKNNSTLYNYDVLLNVVGLFTNSYEVEEELTEKSCQEYLILSVL